MKIGTYGCHFDGLNEGDVMVVGKRREEGKEGGRKGWVGGRRG